MSAVATMSFDTSAFGMGSRSAFTWPGPLDGSSNTNPMLTQDLHSMSESSVTPERSLTSSPQRGSFTPDQHEFKRQQDRARRDSKMNQRMQRSDSNPYIGSPSILSDLSSPMAMPVYSTAPSSLSLLSDPVNSMPGPSYLSYSPPMPDSVQGGHVFPTGYPQSMHPSYNLSMDYPNAYAPSDYSNRSSSLSDGGMMYQMPAVMTSGGVGGPESGHVRVVQSRPKPRCWEHGCNGRQFSTFSNLLRHQREKSGQAAKASCPNCGAEFTRTTARNGHLLHDKCKQRRNS